MFATRFFYKSITTVMYLPVFSTPSFDKRHPNCAHSRELKHGFKTLTNGLRQESCKLLIVEYLQITSWKTKSVLKTFKLHNGFDAYLEESYKQLPDAIHIADCNWVTAQIY